MNELVITNARIVTRDEIFRGDLVARDGSIVQVVPALRASAAPQAIDFGGDFLLPGLIELHTDNLEKHSRPGRACAGRAAPR